MNNELILIVIIYHKLSNRSYFYMLQEIKNYCKESLEKKLNFGSRITKVVFISHSKLKKFLSRINNKIVNLNLKLVLWPLFLFKGIHMDDMSKIVSEFSLNNSNHIEIKFLSCLMEMPNFRKWLCREILKIINEI